MITKEATCLTCGKVFTYNPRGMHRGKFCSRECYHRGHSLGLTSQKTANIINRTCKICGKVFTIKGRRKLPTHGAIYCSPECFYLAQKTGRTNRKKANAQTIALMKIGKSCHVCGFTRFIEICHIRAASEGGDYSRDNILYLCPNHHRLFDERLLHKGEIAVLPKFAQTAYSLTNFRHNKTPYTLDIKQRICITCGKPFTSANPATKRCYECRTASIKCPVCGKEFFPKNAYQRFCSITCSIRHAQQFRWIKHANLQDISPQ